MKIKSIIYVFLLFTIISCSGLKSTLHLNDNILGITKQTDTTEISLMGSSFTYNLEPPGLYLGDFLFEKTLKLNYETEIVDQKKYSIELVVTKKVNDFIKIYSSRYPSRFQRWLDRSGKYMGIVNDIFISEGVPGDLACLAFVESGFNPHARSKANAVGMWQFIESTGNIYGLSNNFWKDDRKNFEKATRAAARHLKDLFEQFDDWYLALAGYNAGMYKIIAGIKRYNTDDFFALARYRYLKRETKEYVPKFIALLMIYKNFTEYGFLYPPANEIIYDTVILQKPVNLYVVADLVDCAMEDLKELNPSLKRPITPPGDKFALRLPYGSKEKFLYSIQKMTSDELLQVKIHYPKKNDTIFNIAKKYNVSVSNVKKINGIGTNYLIPNRPVFIPIDKFFDNKKLNQFAKAVSYDLPNRYTVENGVHVVKKGETLSHIAYAYGISLNKIVRLNNGLKPGLIRPGQKIILLDNMRSYTNMDITYHIVRSGDTLWDIAQKYNTTVASIKKTNKLSSSNLRPGEKLSINTGILKSYRTKPTHIIRSGDTLWDIAQKYNTTVSRIKKQNKLYSSFLTPGKKLVIPD